MKNDQSPAATAMLGAASSLEVNITSDLASVDVMHQGRKLTIMRNQNQSSAVNPDFAITSRACPPFCIQPSELAPGVKTIGELEVLNFLKEPLINSVRPELIEGRVAQDLDYAASPFMVRQAHHERRGLIRAFSKRFVMAMRL